MFNNIYKGKKVVVTGHTGFKGSWLTQWLLQLGAEVVGISDREYETPSHFGELGIGKEITHNLVDVRNYDEVLAVLTQEKPDMLFHLAAEAIVRTCYDYPRQAFETNVMGTVNVADAVQATDSIKASVFITSDKCYENVEWEYGYRESDQLGGKDPYSATKACAEIALHSLWRSYFNQDQKIASARAGNVIGGGDWAKDRIIPDCIRSWSEEKAVEIRSPKATRPWQHVLEPLSGYMWLMHELYEKNNSVHQESFNFGPNNLREFSVQEVIEDLQKVWTKGEVNINQDQGAKKEAGLLKLCCDKAQNRLEWHAVLNFPETMEMTAKWYYEFYQNKQNAKELTVKDIAIFEGKAKERGLRWAR